MRPKTFASPSNSGPGMSAHGVPSLLLCGASVQDAGDLSADLSPRSGPLLRNVLTYYLSSTLGSMSG